MKKKIIHNLTLLFTLAMVLCQVKTHAAEGMGSNNMESEGIESESMESVGIESESIESEGVESVGIESERVESVTVPTESNELISVVLPVVEEKDLFSFFIDPLHILYHTFGSSGGSVMVEEDACLLFYNRDGSGYTFSSRSDHLEIINKSTVPVEVTITAKLEDADGISIVPSREFGEEDSCDLYLALVDDKGNEQPLSEDGEAFIVVRLDRAPLEAYSYVFCEDTGAYEYVCQVGEVAFDSYFFGLTGACNERGDWTSINGKAHVTISWNVEPIVSEESEAEGNPEDSENSVDSEDSEDSGENPEEESNELPDDVSGNSVSGNDVSGDSVSGNDVLENSVSDNDASDR